MKSDIINQFHLPKYIKGKSFAEASKLIENKFKDREDNASKNTKEELLGRLASAQEYIKMQEALANNSSEVPDMMNGEIPEGMEQFFAGGLMDLFENGKEIGEGIGNTIGGNTGAIVSDLFSPEKSTLSILGNKDASVGQKILGTIPGIGGLVAKGLSDKSRLREESLQSLGANAGYRESDFKYGGSMNKNKYANGGLADIFGVTPEAQNKLNLSATQLPMQTPVFNPGEQDSIFEKGADWLGENYGNLMRYAPVVSNALELNNLERATDPRRERLSTRYKTTPVDEASLINRINDQNTNRALTEASGGDLGALRANLQAAGLGRTRALSDAMIKAEDIERGENAAAQRFNLGVDQFNIGQSNLDLQDRMANEAAFETTRSNLRRGLAEDIGAIGKEEVNKKLVKDIFGYTWNGKYYTDDSGNRYTPEEVRFQIQELRGSRDNATQAMFGGYIKSKKSK